MTDATLALLLFVIIVAFVGVTLSWLSEPPSRHRDIAAKNSDEALELSGKPPADSIESLVEAVNDKLPQTQCAQCGYPGCRPYATAIINDDVPINQCPPGGELLIKDLASFLGKEVLPLNSDFGQSKPAQIAIIDEAVCIGCTLCIAACPVDAIVGASKLMHTVISEQCTGCELCLPPCPVDCIELIAEPATLNRWHWPKPA